MVVEEVNRPLEVMPWFLTRADEHISVSVKYIKTAETG